MPSEELRPSMMLRPVSQNIEYITHESEILKGNALGDPHIRRFPV